MKSWMVQCFNNAYLVKVLTWIRIYLISCKKLINKDILPRKTPLSKWSLADLNLLVVLLNNQTSLEYALTYFKQGSFLASKLKEGVGLSNLDFIKHKQVQAYFNYFIKFLPFDKALANSLKLYQDKQAYYQIIKQKLSYPILLLSVTLLLIVFIFSYLIPQLTSFIPLSNQVSNLLIVLKLIPISLSLLLVVSLGLIIYIYYLVFYKKQLISLTKYTSFKFIISLVYSIELSSLIKLNLSLIQAINLLCQHPSVLVNQLAYLLNEQLEQGNDLTNSIVKLNCFDERFINTLKVGSISNNFSELIDCYVQYNQHLVINKLKLIGISLQVISYLICFSSVIVVYLVMLEPLNILERMG